MTASHDSLPLRLRSPDLTAAAQPLVSLRFAGRASALSANPLAMHNEQMRQVRKEDAASARLARFL